MKFEEFENAVENIVGDGKALININIDKDKTRFVQISLSYNDNSIFFHTKYYEGANRYQRCLMDIKLQLFNANRGDSHV